MVRPMLSRHVNENFCSIPLALGLFISVSVLVAVCARHSKQFHRKYATKSTGTDHSKVAPRSPLLHPKKILTNMVSNKGDHLQGKNGEELEARGINSSPIINGDLEKGACGRNQS